MKVKSPFGKDTRLAALAKYLKSADPQTIENAWEHVYRLLLSIDRTTGLAHVYDSNHMQPGGTFHERAKVLTDLLAEKIDTGHKGLTTQIDFMFRFCVEVYKKALAAGADVGDEAGDETEAAIEGFEVLVKKIVAESIPGIDDNLLKQVADQIKREGDHYYTIEKKRQNVRGEGFEDVLEWLLQTVSGLPKQQLRIRQRADGIPGFRQTPQSEKKAKVPKPDLLIQTPDGRISLQIITAKWSLRQDRLDQFGQEASYYAQKKTQAESVDFTLVTNEMDIPRLRGVLKPPQSSSGGFHFDRVYHINVDLLRAAHGKRFDEQLKVFAEEGRLLSLSDLLKDVQSHIIRPPQPA